MSLHRRQRGRGNAVGCLLRSGEELEDPLRRRQAGLQQVRLCGDLGERHRELARVRDERGDVAEGHRARRDAVAADDRHSDVVEVREELHGGLDDPGQELRAEARAVEPLVLLVELLDRAPAPTEDLHERVTAVHLLDVAVQGAGLGPLGDELPLRAARDEHGDDERQRDREQRDDREERADPQHHAQHADDGEERRQQL